jgi:hypothetical protein
MRPALFALCTLGLALGGQSARTQATTDLTPCVRDLLRIPYLADGALDAQGHWTLFSRPDQLLQQPGLNCSGLTIALAQRLLGRDITLAEATRDRLGDSGREARLGPNWDFAWDLVLNLSEGLPRRVILPEGDGPVNGDGRSLRGFSLDDASLWTGILPRLRTDRVYLASLSRDRPGGRVQHYHAAILLKDPGGRVWFYQTLPEGRSHRLDLCSPEGLQRMLGMFGKGKRILILEVEPARG